MNPAPGPMRLWSVRVLVLAGIAAALHFAQSLFLPLVLAGLLCFLLAPLCEQFERWRFGRIGAVLATTLLSFSLIGGIAYVCATQLIDLADELPKYRTNLLNKVASLKMGKDNPLRRASQTIEEVT